MRRLVLVALLAGAGCGGNGSGAGNNLMPGFNPPAAAANETQIVSPVVKSVLPGTDVTYCSYLETTVNAATDVVHYRVFQSPAGHHAILFAAKEMRPVGTHVCTEDDMINTRFIAAGGGESVGTLQIPDGLAFRIPAGTQLMMQTHWINATTKTVDGQAAAYLTTVPASASRQVLDLFNVTLTNFTIPAGQKMAATTTCQIARDVQLYTLTGHAHEFGSRVEIELIDGGGAPSSLWAHDWQPSYQSAPPYNIYSLAQPLVLKAGQQVRVTCAWDNKTGADLSFPREMCVASGFYFPSVGEIDCVDSVWPAGM